MNSIAIQICAVRLYGRFVHHVHDVSPHIVNYLGQQLDLPPSLTVEVLEREATALEHRQNVLQHLGFQRFDPSVQAQLETWIAQQARRGTLPDALFQQAENYLLDKRVLLPGPSVLERLIIHVCSNVHGKLFETVFKRLSPELRQAIDQLLLVPDGAQHSAFYRLKEYPPAPSIASIQSYLHRYHTVSGHREKTSTRKPWCISRCCPSGMWCRTARISLRMCSRTTAVFGGYTGRKFKPVTFCSYAPAGPASAEEGLQSVHCTDCRHRSHDPRKLYPHPQAAAFQTPAGARSLKPNSSACWTL